MSFSAAPFSSAPFSSVPAVASGTTILGAASISGSISTATAGTVKKFADSSIAVSATVLVAGTVSDQILGATSLLTSASVSVAGTVATGVAGAASLLTSSSVSVAGKISQFPDTEEFIVYINTDIGKIASINTAKSVDANIETLRIFEG